MENKTCSDCRYWFPNVSRDSVVGECRYSPPCVIQNTGGGAWPVTNTEDWCRCWRKNKPVSDAVSVGRPTIFSSDVFYNAIAHVLSTQPSCSLRFLHRAASAQFSVSLSTTRKMIDRLVQDGYIQKNELGGYSAAQTGTDPGTPQTGTPD